jgi:hypothetical protein
MAYAILVLGSNQHRNNGVHTSLERHKMSTDNGRTPDNILPMDDDQRYCLDRRPSEAWVQEIIDRIQTRGTQGRNVADGVCPLESEAGLAEFRATVKPAHRNDTRAEMLTLVFRAIEVLGPLIQAGR